MLRLLRLRPVLLPLAVCLVSAHTLSTAAGGAAAKDAPSPEATLERTETAIVFTPGTEAVGDSIWLVWIREHESYVRVDRRFSRVIADEDGDGTYRWELDAPAPASAVWIAVHLGSGEVAVLDTAEPADVNAPPGHGRRPGRPGVARGRPDRLVVPGSGELHLLFVRPAEGAWSTSVADGAFGDDDGLPNQASEVAMARLLALEIAPPAGGVVPDRLRPDDVVVVLDPLELTATPVRFHPSDFAPGQDARTGEVSR